MPCCPVDPVPVDLIITVTNGGALNGSVAIFFAFETVGGFTWLSGVGTFGTCPLTQWSLVCSKASGLWQLNVPAGTFASFATSTSCNPFFLTFTPVDLTTCGGGGAGAATVTVTI